MAYIGLDRGIRSHWIYQDAEYFKVWFEMLWCARFSRDPHIEPIDGELIEVNYSEFIYGRIKWSERLKVSEQRLRTLLKKLCQEKMIEVVSKHRKCTLYKIINYEKFNQQSNQHSDQPQQGYNSYGNQQDNQSSTSSQPAANQQPTTKEEGSNKVNKVKKEIIKILYGDHVLLSDEQYQKLTNDLTEPILTKLIEDINYWFTQKPTRIKDYKDHNLMIRKWHKNNLDKPLTLINGGKPNYRPNKTGNSGKPILPIVQDGPKSAPVSEERREEMRRKARLLDGKDTGTENR
jgi:hypothetical protein